MGAHLNEGSDSRFGALDQEDPDLQNVEAFVEACLEDGTQTFNWQHLAVLAWNLRQSRPSIRLELEGFGLQFEERAQMRRIRTLHDNPHDRWYGLGSSPTSGGSGWEQITGFAGPNG